MGRAPAVRQNLDVESSRHENEDIVRVGNEGCANFALRPQLCEGGIIDIRLPITVAKFINNCSSLLLSLSKVRSARTTGETCTTADC